MTGLTREDFEKRHAELEEAERLAQDAHTQAAFAEATDTGNEADTAKAKKHLDGIREKRETLTLAFKRAEQDRADEKAKRKREAFDNLFDHIDKDLKARRKAVEAVIEHADGLGAAIKEYYELNDTIRRSWHRYVTKHTRVSAVRAMEGIAEAVEGGQHMGVLAGSILASNHKVSSTVICGGVGSLRGDPLAIEDAIAERLRKRVATSAPADGGK